jgi:hypothetical protein
MPVVFIQEFAIDGDDRSTTNYDAVAERLNGQTDKPAGLIVHTAGFDEQAGVFRIMDVWETQADGERFVSERLMPIVGELLAGRPDAPPPNREGYYDLHDIVRA